MASSVISSIDSALRDLESWVNRDPSLICQWKKLKIRLRNFRVFLFCARNLDKDMLLSSSPWISKDPALKVFSTLGHFLESIEWEVWIYKSRIGSFSAGEEYHSMRETIDAFLGENQCLEGKLDEWYSAISDHMRQSRYLTADAVVKITDLMLENVVDFLDLRQGNQNIDVKLVESMHSMMVYKPFLKNLLCFATETSVELTLVEDLLVHSVVVAIDAARIFSQVLSNQFSPIWEEEMQPKCSKLLQNIMPVDPHVRKAYIQALSSSKWFRRLDAPSQELDDHSIIVMKSFLDSIIAVFWDLLRRYVETNHRDPVKHQWQVLYEGMRFLRTCLKLQATFDEKIRDQIGALVFDAGVLLCSFYQKHAGSDPGLQDLLERIKSLQAEVEEKAPHKSTFSFPSTNAPDFVDSSERTDIEIEEVVNTSTHQPPQSTLSITNEVIGFHDEAASIIDRLERGSKELKVVAIWGMAGLGKTTLASKVYNDPSIMYHFHVRAWCVVSSVLDKQKVFIELLNQIDPGNDYSKWAEQDLVEKLWRCLKGRRYLIYLDDIWTTEAWNSLEQSFPNDVSFGSRIMLTSRHHNVVPSAKLDEEPHLLRSLTDDESLELMQRKLFQGKGWPPGLHEFGMQITEQCKGLPLIIVIVAGLLATMEQKSWEKILDGLSSGIASSAAEQCMNSLELSYKYLPNSLKNCFLYFGIFPEDHEVSTKRLIRLWIAEGFVRETSTETTLETVAEGYMVDLIQRSLVMVAKQRSTGGANPKACRIHDLLREFCLRKAEQANLFHILRGNDQLLDFNEPANLRRLCIYSNPIHFEDSRLFCPRAQSLLFFSSRKKEWHEKHWCHGSFVIDIFKLVKVLDLEQIHLGATIPSEIGLLSRLKFLAIRGAITRLSPSIGNLSNLETLIVDPEGIKMELPTTIWSLQKLKHLYMRTYSDGGGILRYESLENSGILYELETLSGVNFDSIRYMEEHMKKFPNIRRLKCNLGLFTLGHSSFKIVVPDFLSRLESLHMIGGTLNGTTVEFVLPESITKLTLSDFKVPWKNLSNIGKLPNLRILKLLDRAFSGKTWEMNDGEFKNLRYLKLCGLDIVKWTAFSDDQFPELQRLILERCRYLEEIPSYLGTISTLEMIEVPGCADTVNKFSRSHQGRTSGVWKSIHEDKHRSILQLISLHNLCSSIFLLDDMCFCISIDE